MKWNIAAPFFQPNSTSRWIDDFAPSGEHQFHKVPFGGSGGQHSWHQRASRGTPLLGWAHYWQTAGAALLQADGVITLFPQLAATVSARRKLSGPRGVAIVAWCFNLGRFHSGIRRSAARVALRDVEKFIVHSTAEVALISDYLNIPRERVKFVPLQIAPIELTDNEEQSAPFAVAMGSANRDYATLVEAARLTRLPLTIVASTRCVEGISLPPNVTFLTDLSRVQCLSLAQRARLSIVPLADVAAASGQITVIEAQRMGRPVIATDTIGTADYVIDGNTGVLVRPGDPRNLAEAMLSLWNDDAKRAEVARRGEVFAEAKLSDRSAGKALIEVLDEVKRARA